MTDKERIDELEKALRIIQVWTRNNKLRTLDQNSERVLTDIENKCKEVLK